MDDGSAVEARRSEDDLGFTGILPRAFTGTTIGCRFGVPPHIMVDEVFRQVDRQRCDRSRSLCPVPRMAMCSKSTVLNAIAWLELYGFIDKLRRIVRTTGLLGPRVRQTSNAYVLRFPKGLGRLAVNVFHLAPDHNNWAPSESNSEVKKGFQGSGPGPGAEFRGPGRVGSPLAAVSLAS